MRPVLSRADLLQRRCRPLHDEAPWSPAEVDAQLATLADWTHRDGTITRRFRFDDYHDTLAFVNALAWMVHGEDHHPELVVGYDRVDVSWNTHSVGGISENDFICAAKTDAIRHGELR